MARSRVVLASRPYRKVEGRQKGRFIYASWHHLYWQNILFVCHVQISRLHTVTRCLLDTCGHATIRACEREMATFLPHSLFGGLLPPTADGSRGLCRLHQFIDILTTVRRKARSSQGRATLTLPSCNLAVSYPHLVERP